MVEDMVDVKHMLNGGEETMTWYDVPGFKNARVKIKTLKPKRRKELTKQFTVQKRFAGQLMEETDNDALQDAIMHEVVMGWEGIVMDGQPLEFTSENVQALEDNWSQFSTLWNRVVFKQTGLEQEVKESVLGNS